MKKVVLILGSGHCGSTLLDLILSSNQQAFGVGELVSLTKSRDFFTGKKPASNLHGFEDSFWTPDFLRRIEPFLAEKSLSYRLVNKLQPRLLKNRVKLYEQILERSGTPLLIDSSKELGWVRRSLRQINATNTISPFLILIKRHPAGVINSYLRKYPERGFEKILENHHQKMNRLEDFFRSYSGEKKIVNYEDLASEPEQEIERISSWLGMDFDEEMLSFWKHSHHHINGNAGTKSFILKFKEQNSHAVLDESKVAYYGGHKMGIRLDERWKKELTTAQIHAVGHTFSLPDNPL